MRSMKVLSYLNLRAQHLSARFRFLNPNFGSIAIPKTYAETYVIQSKSSLGAYISAFGNAHCCLPLGIWTAISCLTSRAINKLGEDRHLDAQVLRGS